MKGASTLRNVTIAWGLVVSVTVHASTAELVRTIGIAAAALVMLVILVIMTLRSRRQSTDDAPVR
jgi:cytochrome c oxidase subunit IV